MNVSLFGSVTSLTIVLAGAALAGPRASKEVPRTRISPKADSAINLDARTMTTARTPGAGESPGRGATRITTAHTETLEINLLNLGTAPQNVNVQWFWVGRYQTSQNWFRSGDGEKTVLANPNQRETFQAESSAIDAHRTTKKGKSYKSGGSMQGWVVVAYSSEQEILAIKASDPLLENFAGNPPAPQRR